MNSITILESLSLNALPALETVFDGGWLIRFANGFTRRANSVNTIHPPIVPDEDKIARCEALFAARGLRAVFKLTPLASALDAALAARGYLQEAPTSVQQASLAQIALPAPNDMNSTLEISIEEKLTSDFFEVFSLAENINPQHRSTMRMMLEKIDRQTCYMGLRAAGETAAFGVGVLDGEYIGLFFINTQPALRNRGIGRLLMLNLMHWGARNGAKTAYLQVMHTNAPALHLYHALGFQEVYSYWYRVKNGQP